MLDALRLAVRGQPGGVGFVAGEREQILVADLLGWAESLSVTLRPQFQGLRVAVALPSGPDCLGCVLALLSAGATVILCNHSWWPRDLRATLEVCGAAALVGPDLVTSGCRDLCPAILFSRRKDDEATFTFGDTVARPKRHVEASTIAIVAPAGGTRAEPHAVAFDREQVAAWVAGPFTCDTSQHTLVVTTELGHLPTFRRVLQQLATGGSVRLLPRWRPKHLLEDLQRHPGSALWATGTQVDLLLARAQGGIPPLAVVEAMGTPLFPATVAALRSGGVAAHRWYTNTEAGGWIGSATEGRAAHEPAAVQLAAGVDVQLQDHAREPDDYHELWVSGPAAGSNPDGSRHVWPIGDTARWLSDRRLGVGGRVADRFLVRGLAVDPVVVEAALRNHPAVAAVAVVPRPDDEAGAIPVAVIVATDPDYPPFLTDLRDQLATLPEHCHPRAQWVVDTLPIAPTGSLHRRLLTFEEAGR